MAESNKPSAPLYLGIEIGGTKLQFGIGPGDGSPLVALERLTVDPAGGAVGILDRMGTLAERLVQRYRPAAVGIGFGGPVNAAEGRVVRSHQIEGWHEFPMAEWCRRTLGLPAAIGNDCDLAGLAEARFGAGRGRRVVLYVTVGSGIGGGLVIDGEVYRGCGVAATEIGHLRPGLNADRPDETVESLASGWGIAAAAQAHLSEPISHSLLPLREGTGRGPEEVRQRMQEVEEMTEEFAADLLARADGRPEQITARLVAQAATDGNQIALEILRHAIEALGWGIAQAITLLAPAAVVVGGGVSLIGEPLFFAPLRTQVERYVFPPLLRSYEILPWGLGEEVVIHGALALAAQAKEAK